MNTKYKTTSCNVFATKMHFVCIFQAYARNSCDWNYPRSNSRPTARKVLRQTGDMRNNSKYIISLPMLTINNARNGTHLRIMSLTKPRCPAGSRQLFFIHLQAYTEQNINYVGSCIMCQSAANRSASVIRPMPNTNVIRHRRLWRADTHRLLIELWLLTSAYFYYHVSVSNHWQLRDPVIQHYWWPEQKLHAGLV